MVKGTIELLEPYMSAKYENSELVLKIHYPVNTTIED